MSLRIVDGEQRSVRRVTPMRLGRRADPDPFGFRRLGDICGVGASLRAGQSTCTPIQPSRNPRPKAVKI
jgi:hypothetical protein